MMILIKQKEKHCLPWINNTACRILWPNTPQNRIYILALLNDAKYQNALSENTSILLAQTRQTATSWRDQSFFVERWACNSTIRVQFLHCGQLQELVLPLCTVCGLLFYATYASALCVGFSMHAICLPPPDEHKQWWFKNEHAILTLLRSKCWHSLNVYCLPCSVYRLLFTVFCPV